MKFWQATDSFDEMEKISGTRIGRKVRAFGCPVFEVNDKPCHMAREIVWETLELTQLPIGEIWSGSRNNAQSTIQHEEH